MNLPAVVTAECQHCAFQFPTEYRLLGAPVRCNRCSRETILIIAPTGDLPDTGYELTYRDFLRLLQHDSGRRLVERWINTGAGHRQSDSATDLSLHLAVQTDAKKQYEIYRLAMSLWR